MYIYNDLITVMRYVCCHEENWKEEYSFNYI